MDCYKGRDVVVTGGAGFIGSHLAERLVQLDARVTVVDNMERGSMENISGFRDRLEDVKFCDLRSFRAAMNAVQDADLVFHLAFKVGGIPYTGAPAFFSEIWRDGTLINMNLLEACLKEAVVDRVLFTSSACVYSGGLQTRPDSPPIKEDQVFPALPDDAYGWSKLAGELQAKWLFENYGMETVIIRPFNVYGPREFLDRELGHCLPVLCRKALEWPEKPFTVHGDGLQTRCFLYVTDAVEGMLTAMEKGQPATAYNLGTDQPVSIKELALNILRISGRKIKPEFQVDYPVTGVRGRTPDLTRLRSLGWDWKMPLEDGVEKTFAWVRHWLKSHT